MLAWMGLVVLKPSLWVARMEAEARQERGTRI
jgi:hypothetical protein